MATDNETVCEVCANCEVFEAYERFKAAKDAEIAQLVTECNRLKAALKPVMEVTWSKVWRSCGYYTEMASMSTDNAVREAQRVMREGGK